MKISWRFPPSAGGPTQGYTNNDIEGFKGEELIDNLAREICQNSLDAHDDDDKEAVRVVFELKQIPTADYDVFSGYANCLNGCRKFWEAEGDIDAKLDAFLTEAETVLAKPSINVLVASDYHTKGLIGNQTPNKQKTPWRALTGAEGISVKADDNSGGSFGIGKNAPFACSSLSMVFYNTWDKNGDKAFIGVSKLATLLDENGEATQDGKRETLAIKKFMYQGKAVDCIKGKAGPMKVSRNEPAEFMITFEKKEKMGLNLILSEGGSR